MFCNDFWHRFILAKTFCLKCSQNFHPSFVNLLWRRNHFFVFLELMVTYFPLPPPYDVWQLFRYWNWAARKLKKVRVRVSVWVSACVSASVSACQSACEGERGKQQSTRVKICGNHPYHKKSIRLIKKIEKSVLLSNILAFWQLWL